MSLKLIFVRDISVFGVSSTHPSVSIFSCGLPVYLSVTYSITRVEKGHRCTWTQYTTYIHTPAHILCVCVAVQAREWESIAAPSASYTSFGFTLLITVLQQWIQSNTSYQKYPVHHVTSAKSSSNVLTIHIHIYIIHTLQRIAIILHKIAHEGINTRV